MIIVDKALERREAEGRPVRVALVGAGFMGCGVAAQFLTPIRGIRLVAISSRDAERGRLAWGRRSGEAGVAESPAAADRLISAGIPVLCQDPETVCGAGLVDVILEATGDPDFGAAVALAAIAGGKHLVLMNAGLDATVGSELKARADLAGVVYTNVDGDEPGVAMNLLRFVRSIGYRPLAAGNIKGFIDRHRNPDTQRSFAERVGQRPTMITSFADGTKLSFETALIANAAGFGVLEPGMRGPSCGHVREAAERFPVDELLAAGGIVDYVLGAEPFTGAFVLGYNEEPLKQEYMRYFKMGEGPLYVFYTPFHLPHLEVAMTVARAALFGDAAVAPIGAPTVDVVAFAKVDLQPGDVLDGIGGYKAYGVIEPVEDSRRLGHLPMGLSEGCRVVRPCRRDEPIEASAVESRPDRLVARLRRAQDDRFFGRDRPARPASRARIPIRRETS